jgi:hypothetical protein
MSARSRDGGAISEDRFGPGRPFKPRGEAGSSILDLNIRFKTDDLPIKKAARETHRML